MGDFEKELDASAEAARKILAESEALLETAEKERQAYREWQGANQIDESKLNRFFASLPPEERKRVEQERAAFERELAEDLEKAGAPPPAQKDGVPAKKGRMRRYA
ncbi:MAG: hypothetical protein LBE84_12340 [Planctomycetota bacterium]|nr:hypothetical protein [Planctomycetota bacterium]